jgi:SPP1 family phage portal protein
MAYKIEQLKEWLTEHAQLKEQMAEGEAYFNQQNTAILETKKQMGIIRNDKNGKRTVMVEDPYASNQKLASGFLKQQIKQKVNYLINENITLSDMVEETEELYPDWRKDLKQLSTRVSYHIYGAWQFYVEDNETKYKFIDGTQLYPIFITNQSIPDLVIRHYTTMDGIEKAIIYSNTTETHYIKKKKWEYEKEVPIIRKSKVIADETIEEQSVELSQPPFAICFNNDEWKTDLQPIKSFVDIYDKVNSDFANNIIDFQEIYHTVKNYDGQDLEEFNEQLKRLKVVPVGEDGEMQTHQIEVPVEAKKTYLELTRKNIFEFGMAVDVQNIATGNATVVAIQSMYENLNMKAADFEQELQDFWRQVVKLTNEFNLITGSAAVIDNYLMFDKSMISNVNEVYERLSKWIGTIPTEILFELLPDVDKDKAMELMEEEVNQLKTQLLDEQETTGGNNENE